MMQNVEFERGLGVITDAFRSETHLYTLQNNGRHVFEIVDSFPDGYEVWNIGRGNFPFREFVPIVEPHPDIPYHVCTHNMKAIKCDSEETALSVMREAFRKGVDKAKFIKLTNK